MNERFDDVADLELSQDDLALVVGGMRPNSDRSSKVCDVGGGCWPDTDF